LRAEYKAALDHVGYNGNALCVLQNLFGDAFVWRGHDLAKHAAGMIQPVAACFAIGSRPGDAGQAE